MVDAACPAGDHPPVPEDKDDDWSYTGVPRWVAIAFAVVVGLGLLAAALQAFTH